MSIQSVEDKGLIAEARTLFEKNGKGAKRIYIRDNFEITWDKAVIFENSKGRKSMGVPILRKLPRNVNPELLLDEYLLVTYDREDKVSEAIILQVINEKNNGVDNKYVVKNYDRANIKGFTGRLMAKPLDSEISEGRFFVDGKVSGKVFGNKKPNSLKNGRMENEQCWRIYLITYYDDGTVTEHTLYYICVDEEDAASGDENGNGGSSSGEPNSQPECTLDISDATASSESLSESFGGVGTLERTKLYSWKAVKGPTYSIVSNEVGVHKRISSNDPWKWYSLTHSSVTMDGFVPGISISPSTIYSNATLGEYYANMSLTVYVTYSVICAGSPISAYRTFPTNMNFYVN